MIRGKIILQNLHFERLFSSLRTMQFVAPLFFTKDYISEQIQKLVISNNHENLARIRVTIFRGDGGLHDVNNQPNFIIQSHALSAFPSFNEEGLHLNIYRDSRKAIDSFSHIKHNNYLPSAMAAMWCKTNNLNDALLLNCHDRIAEATTSNIFLVKDNVLTIPALTEGCVAGVIRRYLLSCFQAKNISFLETKILEDDIFNADEMFLTNSGWYIQWVKQCGTTFYTNKTSGKLYEQFITPLYNTL